MIMNMIMIIRGCEGEGEDEGDGDGDDGDGDGDGDGEGDDDDDDDDDDDINNNYNNNNNINTTFILHTQPQCCWWSGDEGFRASTSMYAIDLFCRKHISGMRHLNRQTSLSAVIRVIERKMRIASTGSNYSFQ